MQHQRLDPQHQSGASATSSECGPSDPDGLGVPCCTLSAWPEDSLQDILYPGHSDMSSVQHARVDPQRVSGMSVASSIDRPISSQPSKALSPQHAHSHSSGSEEVCAYSSSCSYARHSPSSNSQLLLLQIFALQVDRRIVQLLHQCCRDRSDL